MALVEIARDGKVGTLALNHYARRNCLSRALIEELLAGLAAFEQEGIRAVVLTTSTFETVWSAGHDVSELPRADVDPLPYTGPLEQLLRSVKIHPAPVIGMIHGSVWGGACDLIMSCDLLMGDPTCSFAITPAKLGLPYNASGFLTFLSRLPLALVKEMFFTAEPLSADRAEQAGLVNQIVPEEQLREKTYDLARTIASRSAASVSVAKHSLNALSQARPLDPVHFEWLQGLRRTAYFGPDYREGIESFLQRRTPNFGSDPIPWQP